MIFYAIGAYVLFALAFSAVIGFQEDDPGLLPLGLLWPLVVAFLPLYLAWKIGQRARRRQLKKKPHGGMPCDRWDCPLCSVSRKQ